jgi:hypothetical protein
MNRPQTGSLSERRTGLLSERHFQRRSPLQSADAFRSPAEAHELGAMNKRISPLKCPCGAYFDLDEAYRFIKNADGTSMYVTDQPTKLVTVTSNTPP